MWRSRKEEGPVEGQQNTSPLKRELQADSRPRENRELSRAHLATMTEMEGRKMQGGDGGGGEVGKQVEHP